MEESLKIFYYLIIFGINLLLLFFEVNCINFCVVGVLFFMDFLDCARIFECSVFERDFVSTKDGDGLVYSVECPVSIRVDEIVLNNCSSVYFGLDENIYFYFAYCCVDDYTFF